MKTSSDPVHTDPRLAERALRAETEGWCDLFDAVDAETRRSLGLVHRPLAGGTLLAAQGIDHLMLNRLAGAPPAAVGAAIDAYERLGVPRFLLSFGSDVADAATAEGTLRGLVRFRRPWATLIRSLEGTPTTTAALPRSLPAGVLLQPAAPADALELGQLLCRGFAVPQRAAPVFAAAVARPRWTALVARAGTRLVAAGLLFTNDTCAYLFAGATEPDFRRRGLQRALIAERMRRAVSAGLPLIASSTGVAVPGEPNPSWQNLVAAGLRPVHLLEHLCPPGSSW